MIDMTRKKHHCVSGIFDLNFVLVKEMMKIAREIWRQGNNIAFQASIKACYSDYSTFNVRNPFNSSRLQMPPRIYLSNRKMYSNWQVGTWQEDKNPFGPGFQIYTSPDAWRYQSGKVTWLWWRFFTMKTGPHLFCHYHKATQCERNGLLRILELWILIC